MLVLVYTCQNATLLEITCHSSNKGLQLQHLTAESFCTHY